MESSNSGPTTFSNARSMRAFSFGGSGYRTTLIHGCYDTLYFCRVSRPKLQAISLSSVFVAVHRFCQQPEIAILNLPIGIAVYCKKMPDATASANCKLQTASCKLQAASCKLQAKHFPAAYGKVLFLTPDGNRLRWVNDDGSLGEAVKLSEFDAVHQKLASTRPDQLTHDTNNP